MSSMIDGIRGERTHGCRGVHLMKHDSRMLWQLRMLQHQQSPHARVWPCVVHSEPAVMESVDKYVSWTRGMVQSAGAFGMKSFLFIYFYFKMRLCT